MAKEPQANSEMLKGILNRMIVGTLVGGGAHFHAALVMGEETQADGGAS